MTSSDPSSPSDTDAPRPDVAGWLVLGTIGTAALFLGWVYAPQRLKLPLLTPLVLGAVVGWGLGRWAAARHVRSPVLVFSVAGFLIAAGIFGGAAESYRLGSKSIRSSLSLSEQGALADAIHREIVEQADDESRERLQAEYEDARRRRAEDVERRKRLLTFSGYLESRIPTQWGRWRPPWPLAFFVAETTLAALLGAWTARRTMDG